MPGSIITAVLPAPYLVPWSGTATKSGDVLNFTSAHGLQTGNIVYTGFSGQAATNILYGFYGIYVIVINSTSINLATSLNNANNNVILSLSSFPTSPTAVSNYPIISSSHFFGIIPLSSWQSRSVSSQIFSLSTSVRISAAVSMVITPTLHSEQPWFIGLKTADDAYFCGIGGTRGNATTFGPVVGDTISGFVWAAVGGTPAITVASGSKLNFRFTINSSKRVVVETLNSSGVWVTSFTSTILPATRDPLYFFVCSAINDVSITDCQVTYL